MTARLQLVGLATLNNRHGIIQVRRKEDSIGKGMAHHYNAITRSRMKYRIEHDHEYVYASWMIH